MENGYPQNGGVNGVANGASGGNGRVRTRSRPFTVDEALPYSPFSSVVPFNSDIIPAPTIGLRSSASLYSTSAERNAGRQGLESLNREAEDQHSTSQRLEQTLGHLQRLLQPEGLTQYKFRTQPKVTSNVTSQNLPKMTLTSFAQKVYDNTSVEFRYPTPDTPSPPLRNTTAPQKAKPPTQPKAKPSQNATPNVQAHKGKSLVAVEIPSMRSNPQSTTPLFAAQQTAVLSQNPQKPVKKPQLAVSPIPKSAIPKSPIPKSQIEVIIPGLPNTFKRNEYTSSQPTPDSPPQVIGQSSLEPKPILPPSVSNPQLAVVIPDLPPTFRPQDYEVVAVPDSPTTPGHLSKKRKFSEYDDDSDGIAGGGLDQREKADAAFRSLHDYLRTIFEAQDQFDPGLNMPTALFVVMGEEVVLTPAVQTKVDTLLQKIIELGRFSQVPLDDLLRLLRLCDGALKATESVDLKVDEAMGESEVDVLAQQISDSELGLKAARICLRLMSGGREEKQLYSEDVIQAALNAFKNSMENCIIPIVEMRSSGASASSFKLLSTHKKLILNHLSQCKRLFKLMATLVANIDLSETVLNTLEFTASRLIFVENAHVERDSILGVSKFDGLRVVAMDVLAQIFLNSPTQRQGIFDEILTSLEKLPVTKQSARQFKIPEGGSIQLVSALIMRLIQTSASKPDEGKAKRTRKALEALDGDGDPDAPSNSSNVIKTTKEHPAHDTERRAVIQHVTAIQELDAVVAPLLDTAKANAIYVVGFIVNRAQKSTKSGDTPYRNLLDLFVEDFITCLRHPDWPAAELLLRLFVFKMVALAEGDKTAAPAKNMALDLLGLMAAAISDLNSHIQKSAHSVDIVSGDLGEYLSRLAIVSLEKKGCFEDIVAWTGPYRASLESLQERCGADTQQLDSAVSFLTSEWAAKVTSTYELISDEDDDHEQTEQEYGRLAFRLRMMLSDKKWLSREYDFNSVAINQAKLAYGVILLHSQFCESFGRVLQILLTSMASEQATVRSKSIKSVNQLLETDPTILDRNDTVRLLILRCANDPSVQVRDSALGLIGKCITLRPTLEEGMIPSILQRVTDGGVGVRKRAMKLCKDIYLRNSKQEIRSSIADSLLHRVTDFDEGVQELARQTIEEVWLSPFYQPTLSNETSPQFKLALADQVALMTKTLHRGSDMSSVLDKVLQSMLSESSKAAAANFRVCTALVAAMFETIIDNPANEGSDAPSARNALQVLTIFAKSNAKLFTPDQIMLLQPYVNNVGAKDDLAVYRSVVVIFRHVLPHMSKAHNNFLVAIRNQLFPSITRMNKFILDDLMACLWIISETLDDYKNLASTAIQTLTKITAKKNDDLHHPSRPEDIPSLIKLLTITGMLGKHCNLDPQLANFKQRFPSMKGNVSRLMADTFAPFANPKQPVDVRKAAMEAIGMVCQSWPKNFTSANIYTGFREVFDEGNTTLETIILRSWKEFLAIEEKRSEAGAEALPGSAADPAAKLGVMGGSQGDGVALSIAQMFLADIIRIALATQDDQALLATEVLASINRQGLVHPKETAKALIALETSQNAKISELAFQEHRAAHEKHETILEKEYMSGVYQAYCYHRDVTKNVQGATINPYVPKLHRMIEVLKISKTKNRKKFYEALCKRIDFDPVKMEYESLPEHLEFSQFIIENMAFFEYASIDELMSAISAMEKVVSGTGTGIAHAIETEIFHVQMDQPSQVDENGVAQPIEPVVNPARLGELTAFSMVLSSLWQTRTYLRRQYGLTTNRKETKGKAATKDLNKPPVKAPGINGDKLWEEMGTIMNSSTSQESMMAQCRSFVELLSVDEDFRLTAEGDEDAERTRLATPSDDEGDGTPGPPGGSGRGRKRKAAGTPGNRKKRARSTSKSRVSGHPRKKSIGSHESDHEEAWNW